MKRGKNFEVILKAARPKGLDEPARAFYESGLEKGYGIGYAEGFEEGKRQGRTEGARVWAEFAAENEKAAKPKTKKLPNGDLLTRF